MLEDGIAHDLALQVERNLDATSVLDYSLLGQNFGEIIFLYYYARKYGIDFQVPDIFLEKMLSGQIRYKSIGSYCNGLAGLGIGLMCLEQDGFIEGVDSVLHNLDIRLKTTEEFLLDRKHIDFLHGFIGIGFYLLKRYETCKDFAVSELQKIVRYLYDIASRNAGQIFWRLDVADDYKKYNISLSHGCASILLFLARLTHYNVGYECNSLVMELLSGVKNYLLSNRIDYLTFGSFFSTFPKESVTKLSCSRLAWCYGDIGVALALGEAAVVSDDMALYDFSMKVLKYASLRRGTLENGVCDGCLCHGAAGLALIFHKFYDDIGEKCFYDAYRYWENELLKMRNYVDGYVSFLSYDSTPGKWNVHYGILDGISGIGLLLVGANDFLCRVMLLDKEFYL